METGGRPGELAPRGEPGWVQDAPSHSLAPTADPVTARPAGHRGSGALHGAVSPVSPLCPPPRAR